MLPSLKHIKHLKYSLKEQWKDIEPVKHKGLEKKDKQRSTKHKQIGQKQERDTRASDVHAPNYDNNNQMTLVEVVKTGDI